VKKYFIIVSIILGFYASTGHAQQTSFGFGVGYVQVFSPLAVGLNIHADVTTQITNNFGLQLAGDIITGSGGTGIFLNVKPLLFAELFSGSKFYVGPAVGVLLSPSGTALGLGLSFGSMQYLGNNFLWFAQGDLLLGGILIFNVGVRFEV
jgi:hypothetical protein